VLVLLVRILMSKSGFEDEVLIKLIVGVDTQTLAEKKVLRTLII
jgi:hypothetical protein